MKATYAQIAEFLREKQVHPICRECSSANLGLYGWQATEGKHDELAEFQVIAQSAQGNDPIIALAFKLVCNNCGGVREFSMEPIQAWMKEKGHAG